ncbi:MAG: hypothetical protein WCI74_21840, partial [Actinomycetes bacterium]
MTGTRPATSAWTQLWRSLTSGPAPTSPWGSAVRRGLVVAAIMAVGAAMGELGHASVASIGALNLGLVAGAVPRRTLVRATLTVAALATVVTFVTALAAGTWWTVPLLVLIALVTGTVTGSGMVALNAGFMSLVTAIVFTNDPSDVGGAAVLAGLVLLGSLIQAVASILVWDRERRA